VGGVGSLLAKTRERAIWIGVLLAVLGGWLIVEGSSTKDAADAALRTNFGSSVMTIGLVGVLYDLLLRRLLVAEVLDAVGVHESARAFGLKRISDRRQLPLNSFLEGAKELIVMPLDPLRWVDQDFEVIRERTRQKPLKLTVLIPANDEPYVSILAERLGKPVGQVEQMIDDAVTGKLGDAWDAEPPCKGSTLEVHRFAGLPATGLLMTDRLVAVETGPLIRYQHLNREGYVIVAERAATPMAHWVEAQLARERSDENLSQIDARPRPTAQDDGTEGEATEVQPESDSPTEGGGTT
jgi:hypothetical protein